MTLSSRKSLGTMMRDIRDAVDPSDLEFAKKHSSKIHPNQIITAMQFGGEDASTTPSNTIALSTLGLIGATVLFGIILYHATKTTNDER